MISLLIGTKGSGKTKAFIQKIEEAKKSEKGNIVCISKGGRLRTSLNHHVRLIEIDEFDISSYKVFYGLICGVISTDFDITHIFIDRITRLISDDIEAFSKFMGFIEDLSEKLGVSFTISVSADLAIVPETVNKFSVTF